MRAATGTKGVGAGRRWGRVAHETGSGGAQTLAACLSILCESEAVDETSERGREATGDRNTTREMIFYSPADRRGMG